MTVIGVEKLGTRSCAVSLTAQLPDVLIDSTKPVGLGAKAWTVTCVSPWCTRVY